jgi:NTP pyrophosphatase (non-canonical NTP hydrolase)
MKAGQTTSLSDLQKKLAHHEQELRIEFKTLTKKEKDVLAKTVKLQEEIGELANDILATLSLQRKSKLETFKKRNLYQEFADVILATVALANGLGVDIDLAVRNKLRKVLKEYTADK